MMELRICGSSSNSALCFLELNFLAYMQHIMQYGLKRGKKTPPMGWSSKDFITTKRMLLQEHTVLVTSHHNDNHRSTVCLLKTITYRMVSLSYFSYMGVYSPLAMKSCKRIINLTNPALCLCGTFLFLFPSLYKGFIFPIWNEQQLMLRI